LIRQELLDRLAKAVWVFNVWQVPDFGQHDHARFGNLFGELRANPGWIEQVSLTDNNEARRVDLAESSSRIMLDGCPSLAGESSRILRIRVSLSKLDQTVDLRGVRIEPRGNQPRENGAQESANWKFASEKDPGFDYGLPPFFGSTMSRYQDQALHLLRISQSEFLRDQASQRVAENVRWSRSRAREPIGHIVGHVRSCVRPRPSRALPNVARIQGENPKLGLKIMLEPGECSMVGSETAQEHERDTMVTGDLIEKAASLHVDLGHVL